MNRRTRNNRDMHWNAKGGLYDWQKFYFKNFGNFSESNAKILP